MQNRNKEQKQKTEKKTETKNRNIVIETKRLKQINIKRKYKVQKD
jgi:hypothetical protein